MRYLGPKWKRARRLNFSLLGTGEELKKRAYAPGQHGQNKAKISEYGKQLQEKQKLRDMYGVNERQFRRLFNLATKSDDVTGVAFFRILESRLDNLVYRLGFASTRNQARQLVNHGHILVNGKKVDIPSYRVKLGDVISLREKSQNHPSVIESLNNTKTRLGFINFDDKKKQATYVRYPERSELNDGINEALIVEFYSRV